MGVCPLLGSAAASIRRSRQRLLPAALGAVALPSLAVLSGFTMAASIVAFALIGFAGRRTIEGTIGEKLPEGFQTAEFSLKHGTVYAVVPRRDLRDTLIRILSILWPTKISE
jgi:acetyl-CoA carboxylase carboxyl transferase subunit beta